MARYDNGVSALTDVVSFALRQYGTRRAMEQAEVGVTRVRQLQGIGPSNVVADGASPLGESGRGRGRGRRGAEAEGA